MSWKDIIKLDSFKETILNFVDKAKPKDFFEKSVLQLIKHLIENNIAMEDDFIRDKVLKLLEFVSDENFKFSDEMQERLQWVGKI